MIVNRLHRRYWILFLLGLSAFVHADAQVDCAPPAPGSCHLLEDAPTVFVGTLVKNGPDLYHFRIDELIKGAHRKYIDLLPAPISPHFELGQQYLVFTAVTPVSYLAAAVCMPNYPAKYAKALLQQLRAEKNGKRDASVYGMLWRTTDYGISDDHYSRPLPNVTIVLKSGKKIFQAKTDKDGVYSFDRLPRGTYQISAAGLPPHLELAEPMVEGSLPPFALPRGSCFDNELTALPTGRISGRVRGPDGNPIPFAGVELFRAGEYAEGRSGADSYQQGSKPYTFKHLPPGDFVIVFNRLDQFDPDAPFRRTFYPGTSDLKAAKAIHLEDGQQITNADIQLGKPVIQTRTLTVRLLWNGNDPRDYFPPRISAHWGMQLDPTAMDPIPVRSSENQYAVMLLLDSKYLIYADASCKHGKRSIETNEVTVDGHSSVSEITLTFEKRTCPP
jgi:hypothetical protein